MRDIGQWDGQRFGRSPPAAGVASAAAATTKVTAALGVASADHAAEGQGGGGGGGRGGGGGLPPGDPESGDTKDRVQGTEGPIKIHILINIYLPKIH